MHVLNYLALTAIQTHFLLKFAEHQKQVTSCIFWFIHVHLSQLLNNTCVCLKLLSGTPSARIQQLLYPDHRTSNNRSVTFPCGKFKPFANDDKSSMSAESFSIYQGSGCSAHVKYNIVVDYHPVTNQLGVTSREQCIASFLIGHYLTAKSARNCNQRKICRQRNQKARNASIAHSSPRFMTSTVPSDIQKAKQKHQQKKRSYSNAVLQDLSSHQLMDPQPPRKKRRKCKIMYNGHTIVNNHNSKIMDGNGGTKKISYLLRSDDEDSQTDDCRIGGIHIKIHIANTNRHKKSNTQHTAKDSEETLSCMGSDTHSNSNQTDASHTEQSQDYSIKNNTDIKEFSNEPIYCKLPELYHPKRKKRQKRTKVKCTLDFDNI